MDESNKKNLLSEIELTLILKRFEFECNECGAIFKALKDLQQHKTIFTAACRHAKKYKLRRKEK